MNANISSREDQPSSAMPQSRGAKIDRSNRFVLLMAGLGLVVVLIWWFWLQRESSYLDATRSLNADAAHSEHVLLQAYLATRAREHDARLTIARNVLMDEVRAYFDSCKAGAPVFAADARTIPNRVRATFFPDSFKEILNDLLIQHVISPTGLSDALSHHCNLYLSTVSHEEAAFLRDIDSQIDELPLLSAAVTLDLDAFHRVMRDAVDRMASAASRGNFQSAVVLVCEHFIRPPKMVGRLALSRSGVSSSAKAALVRALPEVALRLFAPVEDAFDQFQSDALRLCDDMSEVLIKGDRHAWAEHDALQHILVTDPDPQNREAAACIIRDMRENGWLGLDELLRNVQERQLEIKRRALLQSIDVQE